MSVYEFKFPTDHDGNIIYDYSPESLRERRDYLREVDRYAKMTYKDIQSSLIEGRQIQAIKCGYGKTTALRQFVCRPEVLSEGVLIACHRIEYVDQLAYDITAMLDPEYRKLVVALHSKSHSSEKLKSDPDFLKDYNIVVTTHKRLLLESGGTLLNTSDRLNTLGERLGRKYIFIDEDPQYLVNVPATKSCIGSIVSYIMKDSEVCQCDPKNMDYRYIVKHIIEDLLSYEYAFDYRISTYGGISDKTSYDDLKYNTLRGSRFIHKLNVVVKEVINRLTTGENFSNTIYYHLGMLSTEHIVIFDGTADITCSTSDEWKISRRTPRYLTIDKLQEIPNTNLPRRPEESLDYKEFIEAITHLSSIHKRVLVCTWKDLKGDHDTCVEVLNPGKAVSVEISKTLSTTDSFVEYLKSKLPDYVNNVDFITYMSGEERVTSKYSDCDAILFLGKFYIPNSEVNKLNILKKASQTSKDYTMGLVVQALYRTQARHDKPISIYHTSDWGKQFFVDTLEKFDSISESENKCYSRYLYTHKISNMKYTNRNYKYYKLILDNKDLLISNKQVVIQIPYEYDTKATKRSLCKLCKDEDWIEFESVKSKPKFILKLVNKEKEVDTNGKI